MTLRCATSPWKGESLRRWNDDPFTKKARDQHYKARSVFKLDEIEKRERIFTNVKTVIDLGASPGSWTQYCLEKLRGPGSRIIAVDLSPLKINDPRVLFIEGAIETVDLATALGGSQADLVLSDMAPQTSGIHERDTALSFELATLALDVARTFLRSGGVFVAKLFMGGEFESFQTALKKDFSTVRLLRPESTRKHSREIYFIAKGKR